MTRTQQILSVVLVAQIILAVIVFWPQPVAERGELLFEDLSADQIVAIAIDDDTGNSVALERDGDGWVVSNTDGYPANAEKIEPLLEKLAEIKTGRMVASNPESYDRLQVGDDSFMRRIWFKDASGSEFILFTGSSVGAGATHVRRAGAGEVFLTDRVNSWEFGSEARNWIDVVYLAIPREQMTHMVMENASGTLEFVNQGTGEEDNWMMLGLEEGETFNPNNLVSMLTRLTNLQMTRPLGKEELAEYGFDAPNATITLDYVDEEGNPQTLVLRVGALDPGDNHYFTHASTSEYYVKIPRYSMQDFVERSKDVFLMTEETAEPAEEDSQE